MADPALDFWLRHVAAEGGLHEPSGDATYVVLPSTLGERYRLPEELRVTADPDIARDEGVTLLALGHPVLSEAAERVVLTGDAGTISLTRPSGPPPSADVLLTALRDAVPVDHGRIDVDEPPAAVRHPVIRVGALVTYELSSDDRFQEQAERWVDVPSHRELPPAIADRLARAAVDTGTAGGPLDVSAAVGEAHRLIDAAALARRETLGRDVNGAYDAERGRAVAYYADAIASVERRLATAPADRRAVLEERLRGTREEQARRLAEIAEKYAGSHSIRPYRLHVIEVPALRMAVDVRRGDRRYPMTFDWLLPVGVFAPVRCPSCGGEAALVASKQRLGCETCLPPRTVSNPAPPRVAAAPAAAAPSKPTTARAPAKTPSATAPVPPRARRKSATNRKPPEKLAEELWEQVARGPLGDATRVLEPGSPASALYEVLGAPGLTQVIGMPPHVPPHRYTAGPWQSRATAEMISGTLLGSDDSQYTYFLGYRDALVTEVLPCPVYESGELWKLYWFGGTGDETWKPSRVPHDADVDPVGRILLGTGPSWHGLAVTARAVAAWERIPDSHERLLDGRAPKVVAAVVHRLVAYRAGARATFADASVVYRADEQAIRQADRAVRPLLALGPGRPW
jgi:hypothetical protein